MQGRGVGYIEEREREGECVRVHLFRILHWGKEEKGKH
jgi:hypothetical protein